MMMMMKGTLLFAQGTLSTTFPPQTWVLWCFRSSPWSITTTRWSLPWSLAMMSVAPRRMFQVFAPWVWVPWMCGSVCWGISLRVDLYSTKTHRKTLWKKENLCNRFVFGRDDNDIVNLFFNLGATHENIWAEETMGNHKGKNACHVSTERVHAMYSLQVPSEVDSRDGGSAMAGIEVRQIHGCIYFFHSLNHWTFTVVVHAQDKLPCRVLSSPYQFHQSSI